MSGKLEGSYQASLGESTGKEVSTPVALFGNPDGLGRFAVNANHVRHLTKIPHEAHSLLEVSGGGCFDSSDVLKLDACVHGCVVLRCLMSQR
jgi:hypothetical protein